MVFNWVSFHQDYGPCSGCLEDLDVKEDCVTFLANGERALRQRTVCNLGYLAPFFGFRPHCSAVVNICIVLKCIVICSFWVHARGNWIQDGKLQALDLDDIRSMLLGRNQNRVLCWALSRCQRLPTFVQISEISEVHLPLAPDTQLGVNRRWVLNFSSTFERTLVIQARNMAV